MKTLDETLELLKAAVQAAQDIFQLGEYDIQICDDVLSDPDVPTEIYLNPDYLRARIRVDLAHYQRHPEKIPGDMAHEVAHCLQSDFQTFFNGLASTTQNDPAVSRLYKSAMERQATKLQRMFERHFVK